MKRHIGIKIAKNVKRVQMENIGESVQTVMVVQMVLRDVGTVVIAGIHHIGMDTSVYLALKTLYCPMWMIMVSAYILANRLVQMGICGHAEIEITIAHYL